MSQRNRSNKDDIKNHLPDPEELARKLAGAKSIDDFYGKDGIFARLFSETIEQMLEAELTEELGYDRYEAEGRNSGNSQWALHQEDAHFRGRCEDQNAA